jgi:hypothetical protein
MIVQTNDKPAYAVLSVISRHDGRLRQRTGFHPPQAGSNPIADIMPEN